METPTPPQAICCSSTLSLQRDVGGGGKVFKNTEELRKQKREQGLQSQTNPREVYKNMIFLKCGSLHKGYLRIVG